MGNTKNAQDQFLITFVIDFLITRQLLLRHLMIRAKLILVISKHK